MSDAKERRDRIWIVLLCRRARDGWEPLRNVSTARLTGWVNPQGEHDDAHPEELNYEPRNPDPISTIPGEPNYSPTYPKSTE